MLIEDEILLSEFRKAFRKNAHEGIVDLDASFTRKFDCHIQRFEEVIPGATRSIPPNRWSYFRIGLIRKGYGEFITGIHKFKAKENTLVVVPARVITSSKNWALDMEGYIVLFNIDFFLQNNFSHQNIENKRVLTGSTQPYIYLTDETAADLAAIFETLIEEKRDGNTNKEEFMALKIMELLIKSERLFDEQLHFETNQPSIDIIRKFIDLVENNFIEKRSVSFYAEQLGVHPNYLNSLIKKNIGITAKECLQNRLLIEVKYLLHSTNLTIKEISNKVGFNDPNYFTSFFTRLENISPKNYRNTFI